MANQERNRSNKANFYIKMRNHCFQGLGYQQQFLCHWTALSGREHLLRSEIEGTRMFPKDKHYNDKQASCLHHSCLSPLNDYRLLTCYSQLGTHYRGALKCRDKSLVLEPNHGLQVVLARWNWIRDSPSLCLNFFICYLRRGNSDIIKEWLKWWIQFFHVSCLE